ncbi:hypothetical protein [Pseudobythopirellula maris]|uniref:hypothetical protein n=1 Tax=Pseudobythopirellula maris TaxID=2527991 RepID=UPI0011B7C2D0|nr:hypothetical protein [Pseudobythopirellula maris]
MIRSLSVVALGFLGYYAYEVGERLLRPSSLQPAPGAPTLGDAGQGDATAAPRMTFADEPASGAGNVVLGRALYALEQWPSLATNVSQVGWIDGQHVETSGSYLQKGSGDRRRFAWLLQGRIAGSAVRLLRVSDGRLLYTDLMWADDDPTDGVPGDRSISSVDLRRLRQLNDSEDPSPNEPAPGMASASLIDPQKWARFGGAPMLLEALRESFRFSEARLMQLRGRQVYAMIGRWDTPRSDELFGSEGAPTSLPSRAPHHALVVLDGESLFPVRVEYRGVGDSLSRAGLSDDDRLRDSQRPLLRIDFEPPRVGVELDDSQFVYQRPDGYSFRDDTDRVLAAERSRRERLTRQAAGVRAGATTR